MKVSVFNDPGDFIGDLALDRAHVMGQVVRVTSLYTPTKLTTNIQLLSVVATCGINRPAEGSRPGAVWILKLDYMVGQVWGYSPRDDDVLEEAKKVKEVLAQGIRDLGLDVRHGMFSEDG